MVMEKSDVVRVLGERICEVQFEKADGTLRDMKATLLDILLPEQKETKSNKKPNDDVLAVWDTEAEGWRSFRWDRLKSVNGENFVI